MEKEKAQAVEQQAKVSEQKKAQLKQQGLAAPALFFFFLFSIKSEKHQSPVKVNSVLCCKGKLPWCTTDFGILLFFFFPHALIT